MITCEAFRKTLKEKNISTYTLIQKNNIRSATINRLRKNQGISTITINDLCRILKCNDEDILLYIDEENQELEDN